MSLSSIVQVITDLPWKTKTAGGSAVAGVVLVLVWRKLFGKKHKQRRVFPQDTVVIHQIGRGPHVPSLSSFVLKLETYCRAAGLKYENVHGTEKGPKNKWPWIEYKGQIIADSEFCIELINKEQGVNLNGHLSPEEKGIGMAIQRMIEENSYWTVVLERWTYDSAEEVYSIFSVPWFMKWRIRSIMRNMAHGHGMGRHSKEEVLHILRTDLQALSSFLGKKRFLFGDRPCQYDCSVFGLLAQIKWEPIGGYTYPILKEFPNLMTYCDTMRDEFWPDWDDCTQKGRK